MKPKTTIDDGKTIEAVVGVFSSSDDASRVAASLRGPELKLQRVSRNDPAATDDMPAIVYDDIEQIETKDMTKGLLQGGAIGAGSGLLLLGVPGLNIAAPIAGALTGMFIGGVAGIDEANRGVNLPDKSDYQRMLAEGKSFVVIAGDESIRIDLANKMSELGAEEVHQHPPVLQTVRNANESD
ncbi:MAG: hypothetical protein ACI87E_004627 [Mariniblastus sp.]|jgi:hypothetical protein